MFEPSSALSLSPSPTASPARTSEASPTARASTVSPLQAHQYALKIFLASGAAASSEGASPAAASTSTASSTPAATSGFATRAAVPVFHRWIQEQRVPHLLIDVADYTHVRNGPGVVLVGHEANYAIDEADGVQGLLFVRKRPEAGSVRQRLHATFRAALSACVALEDDNSVSPAPVFDVGHLRFSIYNRLLAPPGVATFEAVAAQLAEFLQWLYGTEDVQLSLDTRTRAQFGIDIRVPAPPPLHVLCERLG